MAELMAPPGIFDFLDERERNPEKYGGFDWGREKWFSIPEEGMSIGISQGDFRGEQATPFKYVLIGEGKVVGRLDIEGTLTFLPVGEDGLVKEDDSWQAEGIDRGCCMSLQDYTKRCVTQPEVTRVLNRIMTILAEPRSRS